MKKNNLITLFLAVLFIITPLTFAQDTPEPVSTVTMEPVETVTAEPVTPTPESTETPVPDEPEVPETRVDHETAITTIINTIVGMILAAFGSAPITVAIVAILKKIPALDRFTGPALTFGVAAFLYVLAFIASALGKSIEFESILELLTVIGPAILSFIMTLIAAPVQYEIAKAAEVPVIGQPRPVREVKWQ